MAAPCIFHWASAEGHVFSALTQIGLRVGKPDQRGPDGENRADRERSNAQRFWPNWPNLTVKTIKNIIKMQEKARGTYLEQTVRESASR